jgi:excisionase family DNA binding protein
MVASCTPVDDRRWGSRRCEHAEIEVAMSQERFAEVRFLTVAEVASIMRVSKMTVYRMVHGGELPAVRVGRSFRVPEDEVQKYLRESYMGTA